MRAPTSKWEVMEVPGVATYYTAHLFSIQAKYFVGERKETRSMRRLVAALVPCCPCDSGAKERLFFLYTIEASALACIFTSFCLLPLQCPVSPCLERGHCHGFTPFL